jgi:TonB-linked SusC/RagA family outer membrane protein
MNIDFYASSPGKNQIRLIGKRRILFAILFVSSFLGYAQNQNASFVIDMRDASLKEVMKAIRKQSGYSFLYQDDLIANFRRRDFHIDTNGIDAVMQVLLSGTSLTYEVEDNVIVIKKEAKISRSHQIEIIKVTGLVTEAGTGLPLPGVTVFVKGSNRGTSTDAEGRYSLDAGDSEVLVFSFIGLTTVEVAVNGQSVIDVVLQENIEELGEVVVTGYQQINKESFTGRVATVSGEELRKFNPTNIFQGIQAYDPSFRIVENNLLGSDPNHLPEFNVRGSTALPNGTAGVDRNNLRSNPNLPIFILDGFEVPMQTVYDMDVNRIESINLLKDAAATAVYGSRAANGVMVITTRTPAEGKLRFSYTYDMTVSAPDLSVYDVLNGREKLEYERLAGLYDADSKINWNALNQDDYDVLYYQKKKLVEMGVDSYWLSEPVETVVGHKNSLMIEGGSESIRYGITAQFQTDPGVMKGSERNRYGADVYLSYNLNNNVIFRNQLSVSEVASQESKYGSFAGYARMNPYYPKRDADGKILRVLDEWVRRTDGAGTRTTESTMNPLYDASLSSFNKTKYDQVSNNFSINYRIIDGLLLKGQVAIIKRKQVHDNFISPLANRYYFYSGSDLKNRGDYFFDETDQTSFDSQATLSYLKTVGNHTVNATLGANILDKTTDIKEIKARGFTNDRFDNIGFANSYYENDSPVGFASTERLVGSFMSVNYSYKDKYLIDVTGRLDGSSAFGTDNKVAPFWAAGLGWNLHHEKFMTSISSINQLRITANTGMTGSVQFPPYLANTTYQYYREWYSTGVGAEYLSYGNEALTWQRTNNYDINADVVLFDNRFTISPSYYVKLTEDMIADISVAPSLGFSSYTDNLGQIENKGYELDVALVVLRKRDWNISLTAALRHNTNKLKKISNKLKGYNDKADDQQSETEYQGIPLLRFHEGQSLQTIYAVRSLGIDPENGKEIFVKRDGSLTYDYDILDIVPAGDETHKLYGFFGANVSYKNFQLYLSVYTHTGGDLYNTTLIERVENADPRFNVDQRVLDDRWKNPGDETFYKDIADVNPTRASSRFIQPNKVLELKTAQLSYDAPSKIYSKLRMQQLRLSLTMNDAWRWSAIKMERGIDYPFERSFTFSLLTRF